MRFALSAMATNTGCTFEGELAITLKMSAVTVCRSSASWVSFEQARVLHRDHCLPGEAFQKRDLFLTKGPDLRPAESDVAEQPSLPAQGN